MEWGGQRTVSRNSRTASSTASVWTKVTVDRKLEETSSASRIAARRGCSDPSSHQARMVRSATPVRLHGGPASVRASYLSWSSSSETVRSTPARSSTWPCRSRRSPRANAPWTSAAQSRRCCGPEPTGRKETSWKSNQGSEPELEGYGLAALVAWLSASTSASSNAKVSALACAAWLTFLAPGMGSTPSCWISHRRAT